MKKKTLLLFLIATVISAMFFTACGKEEPLTLEKYCQEHPDVQANIDEAMTGTNVVVEIRENEILYNFDLSKMDGYTEELVRSDAIISALDEALSAAGPTFGGIAKSIEESTEISGISTTVNYQWGDEVLVTKTFTSADADSE